MKDLRARRPIYKMPKPADLPDPPEGYGYVGMGVPATPFLESKKEVIISRFTPKTVPTYSVDGQLHDQWALRDWFVGVRRDCHYAMPMDVWKRIEYPPELNKHAHQH